MKIIGINFLSESSVCLLENGKLTYAISEERINRKKNWYGLPFKSIDHLLKETSNKLSDIDFFTTCGLSAFTKDMPNLNYFDLKIEKIKKSNLKKNLKNKQINFLHKRIIHEDLVINHRTKKAILRLKKKYKNLLVYDHHTAHAASACYNSGFKNGYSLTIDGWGDNASAKLFKYNEGQIKEISSTPTVDSLGYFYGGITKLLGFKPHQHEGKILGLAAYGNYKKALKDMSKIISFNKKTNQFEAHYENGLYQATFNNLNFNYLKKKYSREDIAATTQYILEKSVLDCVKNIKKKKFNLCVAGGIFANVKLNQKINELNKVNKLYIFPNMGDGGLSVGAASLCYYEKTKKIPSKIKNVYLGPEYNDKEILSSIKKFKVKYCKPKNIEKIIAVHLSNNKIVAHFNGRMEFGPRALGNRSILCSAEDATINQSLNKKLQRTEFMPFAPITSKESAKKYFIIGNNYDPYRFMTVTCNCIGVMVKSSPAAVHIDKTARPQIVDSKDNKRLYKIIQEYKKITGTPILINTSFNMHEEPIVCSPKDALRAFIDGKIDYLILNNYLIERNENKKSNF
jgi:carbamoyltransferase